MPDIVTRQGITPVSTAKPVKVSEKIAVDNIMVVDVDAEEIKDSDITPLTEEEIHAIHEAVVEADPESVEKLKAAKEETEATAETAELEVQTVDEYNEEDPLINPDEIKETDTDIKEALKPYGISDDDAVAVVELLRKYKQDHNVKGLYNKCPQSMKTVVDGIVMSSSIPKGQIQTARNNAVAMLLDSFTQDAKFNQAFDELEQSMNEAITSMNEEYNALFNEAINETFNRLDEIRAENPEQASRIEATKKAFDDADTFAKERELLTHTSAKKLAKWTGRFSGEAFSLNKRVSNTSMKLPKIEDLFTPIRNHLLDDEYSDEDIMKFLTLICRAHMNSDFTTDISELAYIYKLLSTVYSYTFVDLTDELDETGTKIFTNIKEVLDTIKSL